MSGNALRGANAVAARLPRVTLSVGLEHVGEVAGVKMEGEN